MRRILILGLACVLLAGAAFAQRGFGGFGGRGPFEAGPNISYDGRFTFVRVSYDTAPGGYWAGGRPSWMHGYPLAEQNLMKIMNEITFLDAHDEVNTIAARRSGAVQVSRGLHHRSRLVDADRSRGGGAARLPAEGRLPHRRRLQADRLARHAGGGWEPFAENMKRVLPEARLLDMQPADPVFHAFFEINDLDNFPQAYNSGQPVFRGVFEDNDRRKRLMMIVNYNTDVSQFWEWSGRGFRPFDDTNEAYKLGVNYLIYGMTH